MIRSHFNLCTFIGVVKQPLAHWVSKIASLPYVTFDLVVNLGFADPMFIKCTILSPRLVALADRDLVPGSTVLVAGRLSTYKGRMGKILVQKWGLNVDKLARLADSEFIYAVDDSFAHVEPDVVKEIEEREEAKTEEPAP